MIEYSEQQILKRMIGGSKKYYTDEARFAAATQGRSHHGLSIDKLILVMCSNPLKFLILSSSSLLRVLRKKILLHPSTVYV